MPMYSLKPPEVEARQLDTHNVEELAAWCGGDIVTEIDAEDPSKTQQGINFTVEDESGTKNSFRISQGQYLVKDPTNGLFSVMPASVFQAHYRASGS